MVVKSKLSKLLSRPLNSDKIDQINLWSLINHTVLIMRAKLSTRYVLGARLLINRMSTQGWAHRRKANIVARVQ